MAQRATSANASGGRGSVAVQSSSNKKSVLVGFG
jgi:hypothetical protein